MRVRIVFRTQLNVLRDRKLALGSSKSLEEFLKMRSRELIDQCRRRSLFNVVDRMRFIPERLLSVMELHEICAPDDWGFSIYHEFFSAAVVSR